MSDLILQLTRPALVLALTMGLAGCGSGKSVDSVISGPSLHSGPTIFPMGISPLIPESKFESVRTYYDGETLPPAGTAYLRLWHTGNTRLAPFHNGYVSNLSELWNIPSQIRSVGRGADVILNAFDLFTRDLYTPIRGGGPNAALTMELDQRVFPFGVDNQDLMFQAYINVPQVIMATADGDTGVIANSWTTGGSAEQSPVTQMSFVVYFKDVTTGQAIAYIMCFYESRGPYQEAIANDTYVNFASVPFLPGTRYATLSPFSATLQSVPFSDTRFFRMSINRRTIGNFLNDMRVRFPASTMTLDPANLQLSSVGVLFELPNYVPGGYNYSKFHVENFGIYSNRY